MGETNQVIWTTEGQLTLRISMRFTHVYRISETPRQLHTPPQQQVAPLAAAKKEWYLLHCRCWDVLCPLVLKANISKQPSVERYTQRERESTKWGASANNTTTHERLFCATIFAN